FSQSSSSHRHLHSFPTRRSSDLENRYRQNEIRQRPGDDNGRALAHWLKHEALGARGLVHAGKTRVARNARHVVIAEKLDESAERDRKSTRLNSSHVSISYAVFCL